VHDYVALYRVYIALHMGLLLFAVDPCPYKKGLDLLQETLPLPYINTERQVQPALETNPTA
jgi:hypothetical protein